MMSYARKNIKNVTGSIVGVIIVAAIAIWQFYLFVTFTGTAGAGNAQGSTSHLWWAVAMTVFAFGAAFLVFSVFVRHDTDDDLHITSTRRA
jgi:Kef-type K+ transport system membrane component KefB